MFRNKKEWEFWNIFFINNKMFMDSKNVQVFTKNVFLFKNCSKIWKQMFEKTKTSSWFFQKVVYKKNESEQNFASSKIFMNGKIS